LDDAEPEAVRPVLDLIAFLGVGLPALPRRERVFARVVGKTRAAPTMISSGARSTTIWDGGAVAPMRDSDDLTVARLYSGSDAG
jgi:hypothetical protein